VGVKTFEAIHTDLAQIYSSTVTNLKQKAQLISNKTGQALPSEFNLLYAHKHAISKDARRKAFYWTINNMLGRKQDNTNNFLANLEYNFIESMDMIAHNVGRLESTVEMIDHFKRIGAIDNTKIYREVDLAVQRTLATLEEKSSPNNVIAREMLLNQYKQKFSTFNFGIFDASNIDPKRGFYQGMYQAFNKGRSYLNDTYSETLGFKYETLDQLEALYKSDLDADKKEAIESIMEFEYAFEDFKADIIATFPEVKTEILAIAKRLAHQGKATFVNQFAQKIPGQSGGDYYAYKPLHDMDLGYIERTLKFYESGDTNETRLAIAISQGKVFLMNEDIADHLHNKFFTSKQPEVFLKTVRDVGRTSTKLIMSSPFRLATRAVQFTMTDIMLMGLVDPAFIVEAPTAFKHISAFMQSKGEAINNGQLEELKDFIHHMGFDPILGKGMDLVSFEQDVSMPKMGKAYFDFVDKVLGYQMFLGRYTLWRRVKQSFDDPNKTNIYGTHIHT
jgi:hypothetical protein